MRWKVLGALEGPRWWLVAWSELGQKLGEDALAALIARGSDLLEDANSGEGRGLPEQSLDLCPVRVKLGGTASPGGCSSAAWLNPGHA